MASLSSNDRRAGRARPALLLAAALGLGFIGAGALLLTLLGFDIHLPWSTDRREAAASATGTTTAEATAAKPSASAHAPAEGFPRTLTDSSGQTITLAAPPRRIVSQTLGTDEILLAICPHDRIVGLSALARDGRYSNVTKEAEASGIPKTYTPEDILRLKPELVFVASYSRAETVELLRAGGAPVYRFAAFERIDDLFGNVTTIGRAIGEERAAAALLEAARVRLAAVRARKPAGRPAPRVLSLGGTNTTAGTNTLFDDMLTQVGAQNVSAEHGVRGFAQVSSEQVLAWQPDYIVIGADDERGETDREALRRDPAVAATRAVREGRIIVLPNRLLLTTSHRIVDAVEALADELYGAAPR